MKSKTKFKQIQKEWHLICKEDEKLIIDYGKLIRKETANEICRYLIEEKGLIGVVDEIARKYGLIPNKK